MRISPFVVVAFGALVPIGIAVADIAAPEGRNPAADGDHLGMLALGERVVSNIRGARTRTAMALRDARANADLIRATCLEESLAELKRLERKAGEQFGALRGATTPDVARVPYVLLTVVGQKAELVGAEAARCQGADSQGDVGNWLAPPTDPNAVPGDDIVDPMDGFGGKPIIDMHIDVPPVPITASPTR